MRPAWTAQSLRPYVAEIDAQGRATDWLFDSFLFIEYETDSGRGLNYARATPKTSRNRIWPIGSGWRTNGSVRIRGLTNATGQPLFQAVEFEAYER